MIIILLLQIIICFFLGAVFGNIGTTLFFRIPRNIPINGLENPPMCSSCGVKIKYPYYAPFFQFILKGLKCFSCGVQIPIIYTMIEFFVGLFCVIFFLVNPINTYFIIKFLSVVVLLLSFLLFFQNNKFYDKLNWILLSLGLLKIGYEAGGDILYFLISQRIINGLIFAFLFTLITKSKNIQEICFFICLSVLISQVEFFLSSLLSIVILIIIESKKGFFILPFILIYTFIT